MTTKIKADTRQALDAWKAGKPVRSIELGHVQKMLHSEAHLESYPNTRPAIDLAKRIQNDQERVHAYLFHLIELFSINGVPESHEVFLEACEEYEELFASTELTAAEREAAQSVAWKALLLGWKRALDGFPDSQYVEIVNPAAVSAT